MEIRSHNVYNVLVYCLTQSKCLVDVSYYEPYGFLKALSSFFTQV